MTPFKIVLAAVCLCVPTALSAQEGSESQAGTTIGGGGELAVGKPVVRQVGEIYTRAVHGDWVVNCLYSGKDTENCNMQQLVIDKRGDRIARIEVFDVPDVAYLGAGANITTPLGTLLEANLVLAVGKTPAKTYPFKYCLENGCVARLAFTTAEVELLRKSKTMILTIRSVYLPDEPTSGVVSLDGFTAGFAEVQSASRGNQ
ncbi:MAG: invasion associated locus B family protein [Albidovulum sp.]|nr:invasion associated locus B family protein [Albidovulum sp.]